MFPKRFLLYSITLCVLLSFFPLRGMAQNKGSIYLVSVGISDYPGKELDLNCAAADAMAIYDVYQKNGKAHSVLLQNERATVDNIIKTMEKSFSKAKENDIAVLFFSGHGRKGAFLGYDDSVLFTRVRKVFSNCKAKNKMILADACHSGSLRQLNSAKQPAMGNVMVFLSSRTGESSWELRGMDNGIFTHSLLKALKGNADADRNRTITAKELYNFVSKEVKRSSRDKQHPVMWGNFKDNMPVIIW